MDFILFMVFSLMEVFATFYFMFRLFKLDMYYISILFTGLILSYISYTVREVFGLAAVDIVLQFSLVFGFVWLLFRVQFFYAGVITGIGFITLQAIQTFIYFVFNVFGLLSIVPDPNHIFIYFIQIVSCLILYLIGWYVNKKNLGFDFIPHSEHAKVPINKRNAIVLLLYVPVLLSIYLIHYLFYTTNNSFILLIPILLGIVLFSLIYWSYKRDRSND